MDHEALKRHLGAIFTALIKRTDYQWKDKEFCEEDFDHLIDAVVEAHREAEKKFLPREPEESATYEEWDDYYNKREDLSEKMWDFREPKINKAIAVFKKAFMAALMEELSREL